MVGKPLGHYEILEPLGAGGMGEVYRARDTKLDRDVAIKVLLEKLATDATLLARFDREAKLLASINHPNIATIHGLDEVDGTPYLVLELVEGESLARQIDRGPLAIDEALETTRQVAAALEAAHEKGIIHRDLKPANVMVTPKGDVKVLDFGVAKAFGLAEGFTALGEAPTAAAPLTGSGTLVGTSAYMSPEQIRGKPLDKRSDIWSFGCVLYEMLTGTKAFDRETIGDTLSAILEHDPKWDELPVATPTGVRALLFRILQKDPERRLRDIGDARLEIEEAFGSHGILASSGAQPTVQPSIAVLPFVNMSADPENQYFSDGLAEELIDALTKLEGLQVASRTSAFRFRGSDLDIREIGRDLNVGAVLEGSVRKAEGRLRVTAQLVNVADGYHLWSDKYDRALEDVFAIQEEIAGTIVDKLQVSLVGREAGQFVEPNTENLEAYNLYLKGRFFWNKRTDENFIKAKESFREAVREDPQYAPAYAGLADAYALLGIAEYGVLPPKDTMPRAKAAALEALERDANSAEACTTLAHVSAFYDWEWETAEQQFRRAIEVKPEYPMSHHWYASYLAAMGRHDEALAAVQEAWKRDPLSLIINKNLGVILYYARRYDEAIEQYGKTLELDPAFVRTHFYLGIAYEQQGLFNEAIAELEEAARLSEGNNVCLAALGRAYAGSGQRDRAQQILASLRGRSKQRYIPSLGLAAVELALGENDQAFDLLDRAYDERSSWLVSLKTDPWFDDIRTDPRFTNLVQRVGLDQRLPGSG